MASSTLEEQLELWERSGLISAAQRVSIRDFEARAGRDAAVSIAVSLGRPSWIEVLAYLGVIVTVVGVLTLVYTSQASLQWVAAFTQVLAVGALLAAYTFARRGSPPWLRAAGACAGVTAIATGVAAGEFATATSLFTRTVVAHFNCQYPCPSGTITTTSHAGNVLFGAGVGLVVAIGLIRYVPGHVTALVAIAAAYTAAGAAASVAGLDATTSPGTIALVIVAASAGLASFGELLRRRQPAVHGLLGFAGVVGATVPLFVLGGGSNADLDVIGALIAAASLAVGIAAPRAGLAYGAVVGLAGLVIDIGARSFSTATARGVFFIAAGVACMAALIALNRVLTSSRAKVPAPPE